MTKYKRIVGRAAKIAQYLPPLRHNEMPRAVIARQHAERRDRVVRNWRDMLARHSILWMSRRTWS